MRVPDSMSYNNAIRYMNEAKAKLDQLGERASSMKNFQTASDDPSLVSSALVLRSSIIASNGYITTSQNTKAWMETNEMAFNSMNDLIGQANTVMLKAATETVSASERANDYAVQIGQMLIQAISVANTSYNGNYLFAGNQVNTKPFELAADELSVDYSGDAGSMKRDLAPGVTIGMNADGVGAFNPFFDALILAKHGLETNDLTEINTALADINSALTAMNQHRTNNAAILRQIKTGIEHLNATQNELKGLLSIKEDANMAEAISMFNLQQTTYQTVLDVSSRAISALNLFDVLP